jgi:hypothetical protein
MATYNEVGSVPSLSILWNRLRSIGVSSLKVYGTQQSIHHVLGFSLLETFYYCFNVIVCYGFV